MKKKLLDWENRKSLLIELQDELVNKYDPEKFNVFIFGSYITTSFNEESDIDLSIYTAGNNDLFWKLKETIESFFTAVDLPVHALWLEPHEFLRHIDLEVLKANCYLTNFYPMELKTYYYQLLTDQQYYEEEYNSTFNKLKEWVELNNLDPDILTFYTGSRV